jgi:cell division protein FtsI (penicillin-binding protein 3)
MLRNTVSSGTGKEAALAMYDVGGKTGTAKRTSPGGGYERGSYNASFVGLFPADDPQLVILVKLDDPDRSYYGGQTAAPAFRATMQAALAARDAVLDRRALATARSEEADSDGVRQPVAEVADSATTFDLPLASTFAADSSAPATVPDVVGLPLREAVRLLHDAGFRVRVRGSGSVRATTPPAGAAGRRGQLVNVAAER